MKLRRDIQEWMIETSRDRFKGNKNLLKVYQHTDGVLYGALYGEDGKTIERYGYFSIYGIDKNMVEKHFNVKFAPKEAPIVCKCGESEHFSASYGNYKLNLKCNKCGNEFTAYSG